MELKTIQNPNSVTETKYKPQKCSENYALSPPYRNFSNSELKILSKINENKAQCGVKYREYINAEKMESCSLPIYCDNRSCPKCKEHKLYKFKKTHSLQINALTKSMKNPRAWVFTGWVFPIENLSREFCQNKLLKLYNLLRQFSSSEFSVHMEIKIQKTGLVYLHFHVSSAYIKKIRLVAKLWGRKVRNELALKPESLAYYVSKYASKVPRYPTESHSDIYTLLVYKLQMNRFSPKTQAGVSVTVEALYCSPVSPSECMFYRDKYRMRSDAYDKPPPKFYVTELLEKEIENALLRTGYTDNTGRVHMPDYHPFLHRQKNPSPIPKKPQLEKAESGAG